MLKTSKIVLQVKSRILRILRILPHQASEFQNSHVEINDPIYRKIAKCKNNPSIRAIKRVSQPCSSFSFKIFQRREFLNKYS